MVKWGIRSRGKAREESTAYRYRDQGKGRGKGYNPREDREYEYSDEEASYGSQQSDEGEARDAEERYDDEDEENDFEERVKVSYKGDRQRELVTRDQVLGELRAQAAADALGKSLEQMGYNLNNCDSFYSLSDKEDAVDQRYMMIQSQPSIDNTRQIAAKKRRSKKKKKKNKSSAQSRYTLPSDDEEEDSTMYGRSYGDLETYGESFTEVTDDFSYGDESSLTTGMSASYTRFTGKKSGKFRKHASRAAASKSKKHRNKGRGRDNETYYTRGTEWDSIDESSTISSVSEGSGVETEYTEPTRRGRRNNKKADQKHKRRGRGGGDDMRAIEEEDSVEKDSWERQEAPINKRAAEILKRNDSGRFSGSSQIGAMRSMESSIDDVEEVKEDILESATATKLEKKKEKISAKKSKKKSSSMKTGSSSDHDHDEEEEAPKKSPRKHHKSQSFESESFSDESAVDKREAPKKRSTKSHPDKAVETENHDGKEKKQSDNNTEKKADATITSKKAGEATAVTKKKEVRKEAQKVPEKETAAAPGIIFWPRQFLSLRSKKKATEVLQESTSEKLLAEKKDATDDKKIYKETTNSQLIDVDDASSTQSQKLPREPKKSKRESRSRSKSPTKAKKNTSRRTENTTQSNHAKEPFDSFVLPELLNSQDSVAFVTKEADSNPKTTAKAAPPAQTGSSIGLREVAAMAAMLPLAPLAAAYSCYTAESTQSLIKSANCSDIACNTVGSPNAQDDDDDHTRSSKKKKKSSKSSKHDDQSVKTSDCSLKSSKSKRSHKSTISEHTNESSKKDLPVDSKVASSLDLPTGGASSINEPPAARIQEESEGFESFLPGSLGDQGQPESAATPGYTISSILPFSKKGQSSTKQSKKSSDKKKTKKSKLWVPKLRFGSNNKKKSDDKVVYVVELPQKAKDTIPPPLPPPASNAKQGKPPQPLKARVPDRLPFLKLSRKNSAGADSMKALKSFHVETPTNAQQMIAEDEIPNTRAPEGNIRLFNRSKPSTADLDFEDSLLLDTMNQEKKGNAEFDPATATEEELLKYYDLGQTLSEVIDARETLEHAYGLASGGGSFDHTIDEQLVELLTHMAEMDQDDVVEIEAAIKKLKKHARKLGISERDLLFSVKSAEENSMPGTDEPSAGPASIPPGFGDKMMGAFEGYFGRR